MKAIDPLVQAGLQALVLIVIAAIAIMAAVAGKWDIAGTSLAGLFAALNLSRSRTSIPSDPTQPPQGGSSA